MEYIELSYLKTPKPKIKPSPFKGKKCCIKKCKKVARGLLKRKYYCQHHFNIESWKNKLERNNGK